MRRATLPLILALTLAAQQPADMPVFRASANLVVVTVFVRDKNGQPVANLSKNDFTVLENGKPQTVSVFSFEKLDQPEPVSAGAIAAEPVTPAATPAASAAPVRYRDKRLIVLYFDWTSLPPADQVRAKESAEEFINKQMGANDVVALVSFASTLKIDQDFTADREALLSVIKKYQSGVMSELSNEGDIEDADTSEDAAFAADDTEFNIFNTDRKLSALEDMARRLAALPEKKALVYFSSGVGRTGTENDSQLRSTINAAVRANVSFYPVDVRGLTADAPGGNASASGGRGTGLFSGQTQTRQRTQAMQRQETLTALAADTGGKALIDENDLAAGIRQVQQDLQSYYVLGYYSNDDRRDGQYRRIDVKLNPNIQAKLDFRKGYFAEKEFRAFNSYDKERQLQDALLLGDPVTDLRVALEANWFRLGKDRYFVPVALKIPGSAIPLAKKGGAETTEFDFVGQVKNDRGSTVTTVRDSIKIKLRDENAGKLSSQSLTYDTGFTLTHGTYNLKMLVRENQTGKMGTFETKLVIPDLSDQKQVLRLSPVVWSSQRVAFDEAIGVADKGSVKKQQQQHPLVIGKEKLLPSVTRVFRNGQTLYGFAELYDPAEPEPARQPAVAAALALYRNGKLVTQSNPVTISTLREKRNATASILAELPLRNLAAGEYTAQLTVIDNAGQKFTFARTPIVILGNGKS